MSEMPLLLWQPALITARKLHCQALWPQHNEALWLPWLWSCASSRKSASKHFVLLLQR